MVIFDPSLVLCSCHYMSCLVVVDGRVITEKMPCQADQQTTSFHISPLFA